MYSHADEPTQVHIMGNQGAAPSLSADDEDDGYNYNYNDWLEMEGLRDTIQRTWGRTDTSMEYYFGAIIEIEIEEERQAQGDT